MSAARAQEITRTLDGLAEMWRAVPELRLGQLIVNALPARYGNDPFFISDSALIAAIELFVRQFPDRIPA